MKKMIKTKTVQVGGMGKGWSNNFAVWLPMNKIREIVFSKTREKKADKGMMNENITINAEKMKTREARGITRKLARKP